MAPVHAAGNFPRSGHIPPQNVAVPGASSQEAWWQSQGKPDLITVPRALVERLRSVHLAQLDELTRLRIEVAKTRGGENNIRRAQTELQAARSKGIGLQTDAATAAKDVAQNIETIKLLRQNCVETEAELRAIVDRERTLEERFNARAAKAAETERGSVMQMELSIVGIDLKELRELEIVRLVTRPIREAASQCLGLARSSTSACRTEQHGRIGLHLHLPKELRSQPQRFREFKKHFVEAKRSGELRTRLEEGLVDLENEFGARVTVRSVSQPILLDGAFVVVPEGVGALGMVPEGHPPGLVTLWQVAPGSWAQKVGIRSGDTLVWLNKQPVTEIEVGLLAERIRSRRPLAMYVVRAPGPGVQRAKEESAAKKIQSSYRQKLSRNRALDQKRKLRLVELHHDQAQQAAAGADERRRLKEKAELEKLLSERAENKDRMEGALAREEEERLLRERRLREKWDEDKLQQLKRDQERRAEQRRQERERAATQPQAGWRGTPARVETESSRPVVDAALNDLLAGEEDDDAIVWDIETNDKKLGLKLRGEPPNDQVFISSVTPDSWADTQKLQVGDEILMVGGLPIDEMSSQSFYRALKLRPLRITLSRSGIVQASISANGDQRNGAAARIQAGWRGRLGRQKAADLRRDHAQGKALENRQIAAVRTGGAPPGIAPHQWIKVIVEEGVRNIGWTPSGMAPNPMIVEDVVDGSWAQGKRLQVGDELKTVAGMDVGDLDERQLKALMKQRPLALVFYRREGQEGDAKLVKVVAKEDVGKMGWLPDVTDPPRPVMVASVDPTSWAQREGLLVGDELVKIDGSVVARMTQKDLLRDLRRRPVELVFKRRPTFRKPVAVFEAPEESNDYSVTAYKKDKVLGFVPGGVPPYEVPVDYVDEGSWAYDQGIKKDDLLIAINGQSIDQFDEGSFLEAMRVRPLELVFTPAEAQPTSTSPDTGVGPDAIGTHYELIAAVGEGKLGLVPSTMPPSRVYMHKVEDDTWGSRNGVRLGDELLTVNGKSIAELSRADFLKLMAERPLGLVFMRGDGSVPSDGGAGVGEDGGVEMNLDVAPIAGSNLGFVLNDQRPFLVFEVQSDGWASEKGLVHGDELVKIEGRSVSQMSVEQVFKALKWRPVRLTFKRYEGHPHEVSISMTLEGLELAAIENDDLLYDQFYSGLSSTIAAEAGVLPEQVQLVFSEGSVRVHAKIILPITQATAVQARLRNSDALSSNVLNVVRDTPGIEAAKRGRITVKDLDVRESELSSLDFKVPAGVEILGFAPEGLPPNRVMVQDVAPGTWADDMQLIAGRDELHAVDGQRVQTMTKKELVKAMKRRPVKLSFLRHSAKDPAKRIGKKTEQSHTQQEGNSFTILASEAVEQLGFIPAAFPPDPVTVESVQAGTWSEEHGIMEGADELIAVDGVQVSQMTKKQLIKAMKKRPVKLTFERDSARALETGRTSVAGAEANQGADEYDIQYDDDIYDLDVPEDVGTLGCCGQSPAGTLPWLALSARAGTLYLLVVVQKMRKRPVRGLACCIFFWLAAHFPGGGFFPNGWPPDPVFAIDVAPGSWAGENGIWDGDELVEVDGQRVADMSKKELKAAMKRRPVQLSFMRPELQEGVDGELFRYPLDPLAPKAEKGKTKGTIEDSGREGRAATKIQARFRGNVARKQVKEKRVEKSQQDAYNAIRARKGPRQKVPWEDEAATKIQARFRGNAARKQVQEKKALKSEEDALRERNFAKYPGDDTEWRMLEENPDYAFHDRPEDHINPNYGKGEEFEVHADEDAMELGFIPSGFPPEDMYIDEVEDGSWAQSQGLQIDDLLLEVNGEEVYGMDKKTISKMIRKVRPLTLTFWRSSDSAQHGGAQSSSPFTEEAPAFDGYGGVQSGSPFTEEAPAFDGEVKDDDDEWPAWEAEQDVPPKKGKGDVKKEEQAKDKKDKNKKKPKRESESILDDVFAWAGLEEDAPGSQSDVKKATATAGYDDEDLGWTLKGKPRQGVTIEHIEAFGWAEKKKFKVGDALTVVNGKAITEISEEELKDYLEDRPLKVTLERKRKSKKRSQ